MPGQEAVDLAEQAAGDTAADRAGRDRYLGGHQHYRPECDLAYEQVKKNKAIVKPAGVLFRVIDANGSVDEIHKTVGGIVSDFLDLA